MSENFEDAQVIELQRVGVLHKNSVRLLALLAFAYLAYLAVANWRMRVFMRTQASEAGCQLSYSTARTLIPGAFSLKA